MYVYVYMCVWEQRRSTHSCQFIIANHSTHTEITRIRTQVSFLEQAVEDPDPEMAAMAKEDLEGARYVVPCPFSRIGTHIRCPTRSTP